jgi:hypothetical protein
MGRFYYGPRTAQAKAFAHLGEHGGLRALRRAAYSGQRPGGRGCLPRTAQAKAFAHLEEHGDYERYGGPHTPVNALAGAVVCRAPLRLKPSRIWESMGYYERCGVPQLCINALRARLLAGGVAGVLGRKLAQRPAPHGGAYRPRFQPFHPA